MNCFLTSLFLPGWNQRCWCSDPWSSHQVHLYRLGKGETVNTQTVGRRWQIQHFCPLQQMWNESLFINQHQQCSKLLSYCLPPWCLHTETNCHEFHNWQLWTDQGLTRDVPYQWTPSQSTFGNSWIQCKSSMILFILLHQNSFFNFSILLC